MNTEIVDSRLCNVGMSCEDFSLLIIAGPIRKDLSPGLQKRMNRHEKACEYHQTAGFHQSVLGTPVTETLEKAAVEVIEKYMKMDFPWECPECKIGLRRNNGIFHSADGKKSKREEWRCPSCNAKLVRTKGKLFSHP